MPRQTLSPEGRSVRLLRVGEQVRHVLSGILMRGDVHGLTTAAAAWSMVAVGVLAGSGRFAWAGITTAVVLVLLEAAHLPLLDRIDPRRFEGRFRQESDPPRPLRHRHGNDGE